MKRLKQLTIAVAILLLTGCNGKQSLQGYYVESKENKDFVMLDVPTSLLSPASNKMSEEQQRVLKTVKKVNILAYPMNEETKPNYAAEALKVKSILSDGAYEELMSFGKPGQKMRLYFKGEDDAIDEVIIFAQDDNKGFLLARVLGDDMNVSDMVKFAETMDKNGGAFNTGQFEGVMDVFK